MWRIAKISLVFLIIFIIAGFVIFSLRKNTPNLPNIIPSSTDSDSSNSTTSDSSFRLRLEGEILKVDEGYIVVAVSSADNKRKGVEVKISESTKLPFQKLEVGQIVDVEIEVRNINVSPLVTKPEFTATSVRIFPSAAIRK